MDQLDGILEFHFLFTNPAHDEGGGIDGFAQFPGTPAAEMVEHLKPKTQRIHFAVTLPAIGFPGYFHFFTKGQGIIVGQLGIHSDGHIRYRPANEFLAHPKSAPDRMVIEVVGLGHQPGRLGQYPGTLITRQVDRLVGNPFPVRRQVIRQVRAFAFGMRPTRLALVFAVLYETLPGCQQFLQHILVAFVKIHDEPIGISHQHLGCMGSK